MVGSFMGNLWTGESHDSFAGFFIDERADDSSAKRFRRSSAGKRVAGPPASPGSSTRCAESSSRRSRSRSPDDLAHWRVEVPGKARGSAQALTGPTTPEGARVQVHNPPGAEVGPGQIATWGTASEDEVAAFGFKWSWPGRSSKHFPFDWSGPDEA
jgi:hypothetical protein